MTVPKKILVATDFSPCGDRAGRVGQVWAKRFGAELHWAHAAERLSAASLPRSEPLIARYVEQARSEARERLRACFQEARERGLTSEEHMIDVPAGAAIVDLAGTIGADCVVVGTHGREGLKRLWLGSVAGYVARTAPCSVLVVRGQRSPTEPVAVVLGDDLTPLSSSARAGATLLAREFDARLHVVHSLDLGVPYLSNLEVIIPNELFEEAHRDARKALEEVAGESGDLVIENEVVSESAARALCEAADRTSAGLVVVGAGERTRVERVLLGSVAESVVRHSPCSVLVAR